MLYVACSTAENINLAFYQNAVPIVRELSVGNESDTPVSGVEVHLSSEPGFVSPGVWRIDKIAPNDVHHLPTVDLRLHRAGPGSLIAMTAAMLLSKNLIGRLRPEATDAQTVALARWLVPVVMLVAVYFTLTGNATIVTMLLVGYSFVTQLFPAVIASLMPRNPTTPAGAFAGILVGAVVAAVLSFTHATIGSLFPALPQAIRDLNVGIIALAANIVALVAVSAVSRPRTVSADAT